MIKLFISDIDGCLSEPYQTMDMGALIQVAGIAARGGKIGSDRTVPALSLCSGRPMPYVECLTQVLGINVPVLFESGGGIFDPENAKVYWNPHLTEEVLELVGEVTRWFEKDCVPGTSLVVDYAKRAHAGVIGPDAREILEVVPQVQQFVADAGLGFSVLPTHLSIDVVPPGITKEEGLRWLAGMLDLKFREIAYIGDSMGDFEALQVVGCSFAPENGKDVVKEKVDFVMGAGIKGVLGAIHQCIEKNQQIIEIEELND